MILTLIKLNLRALLAGLYRRFNRKKKIKPIVVVLVGLLVVYIVAALGLMFGGMFYVLCAPMFDYGLGWFYFAIAGILVFILCFIGSVFMVQTQVFAARDNELLLSMPIKPLAILSGRLFALLLIEYIYTALIIIPVFAVLIITGYISQISVLGCVFLFVATAMLPLFALAVGCLVGWIVALISSRMRNKNIPALVLSLAFLAVYIWAYTQMVSNIQMLIANGEEIAEAVRRAVFPAYHFGVAVADGSILSLIIFAICAIAPFAVMCVILSLSFTKLTSGGRGAKKIEYKEKALRVASARIALLKKELLQFWSLPMYILNSALGAIASLVLAIILFVRPSLLLDSVMQVAAIIPSFEIGLVGAIVLSALAVLNIVAAPSISLEGKRLWIVKSLPVQAREILLLKAGLHVVVCGAPLVLAGIACVAALPMNGLPQVALTFLLPLSITLMFSLLGITLNLTFPRFDWINPIQPVKQGASCMLTLFGGMALIAALIIVYVILPGGSLSLELYMLMCTAVFVIASAVLYIYIIGAGSRKFETL